MQYIFNKDAGQDTLTLSGDLYKYIVKVRRFKEGVELSLRNLHDDYLYTYVIKNITRREIFLELKEKVFEKKFLSGDLEIFWCVIEPKVIEKTLPLLNQIGVKKITFIYCDRSQKNFRLDFQKYKKIVINSNQQCGRVHIMEFEQSDSLEKLISVYHDMAVLDFGGDTNYHDIKKVLVGCEGGFSEAEKKLLASQKKVAFSTQNILKSETAVVSISSKLLV